MFVFLDISLRALHRSLRAVFRCLIYDFFSFTFVFFFVLILCSGVYIEAARFYLLSSMLQ